jgi:hypothetical protein
VTLNKERKCLCVLVCPPKRAAKAETQREEVVDEREQAIQRLLEPDRPRGSRKAANV